MSNQYHPSRFTLICLTLISFLFLFYLTISSTLISSISIKSSTSSSLSNSFFPSTLVKPYSFDSSTSSNSKLSYREHLKLTTTPSNQLVHSSTLTFDHIYVLSLPSRMDRREEIQLLAEALGLKITFVDAVSKDESFIGWIAERVSEIRQEKIRILAKSRNVKPSEIGGLAVGNDWLAQTQDLEGLIPFPTVDDLRYYPSGNWVTYLESHFDSSTLSKLLPMNENLNVTELLHDSLEVIKSRQVNEAVISTYFGHTRAIKLMIKNQDKSALILEDDVDFEWDLESLWSRVESKLPSNWEITYLGHCWGQELLKPAYLHPHLHQSTSPLCLHAYALSFSGASHILSLLQNPWLAYQTAIDLALPSFISLQQINSFSIEPPFIIQRKDGLSDIQGGTGSRWRGVLMDSTLDRVRKDKGLNVEEEVWIEGIRGDPAREFRYRGKVCD